MGKLFFIFILIASFNAFALPDDSKADCLQPPEWDYKKYADPHCVEKILNALPSDATPEQIKKAQVQILLRIIFEKAKDDHSLEVAGEGLNVDYYSDLSKNTTPPDININQKRILYVTRFKMKFHVDPVVQPLDQLPKIDLKDKTYTFLKKTYDKNEAVVKANAVVSGYDCKWDTTTSRRILHGSGCTDETARICSGYLLCTKEGVSFRGLATCSANNCKADSASACAAEQGYGSKDPADIQTTLNKQNNSSGTQQ